MAMELMKRIRVKFKDDDILSESQKLEGLSRSWILLEPRRYDTVSDVASHLLNAFQLHQSCPHGLLLSITGFVLPPFESTSIFKDNEIICVRRRKDVLSIQGNDAANDVRKLKALEKRPVNDGVLLLTNEEFEKEKGGYESDEPEKESEDDDEGLMEVVENSSGGNSNKKNRKRKAAEKLQGNKEKKQRSEVNGNASTDVCKEKKISSIDEEKKDASIDEEKKDASIDEGGNRKTDDAKVVPKETKKVQSRSARRKTAKRRWLREMLKIKLQNATCESEGLKNWKEDQAKADKKKLDGQWKGQQKWKKYQADAERNKDDGQPKGLLHWKLSSQSNGHVKVKKHKRHNGSDEFLETNRNGDVHKQQNQNGDKHEQLTQMGDALEQPNHSLHEQPGQNGADVQERTNHNSDVPKQSNHKSNEENEVVPIEIRPGHIRFEPLDEEEAVQQDHAPLETYHWNGITSKKKGQQWGKENRRFTPRNDCKTNQEDSETFTKEKRGFSNKEDSETLTKEKEKQSNERVDFDKLPLLPGSPKTGDLIAYKLLELSSTWTPELSEHRVGKVSWYDVESNQTMLLPVPEYPIVSEKDDWDEAAEPDNSLYKEDGSLEIEFSALIDVRVLTNGRSEPGNKTVTRVNEVSTSNVSASKTVLPGSSGEPKAEPSPENGGSVWDELSEALNAKKKELSSENGWGSPPKKVVVSHDNSWGNNAKKPQPSSGSKWGKNTQKPQPSQDNSWGKESTGSRSWSYKALRGSALGPTMAMLRSNKDA